MHTFETHLYSLVYVSVMFWANVDEAETSVFPQQQELLYGEFVYKIEIFTITLSGGVERRQNQNRMDAFNLVFIGLTAE